MTRTQSQDKDVTYFAFFIETGPWTVEFDVAINVDADE